ncbi:hypothetical protein ACGFNX_39655 [Streptomyces sp. NPDC048723]|uniref:hypothetical protein n=1 Tax=Streptomyces sp. NPDC048723 TaxID=3365589 RepID=UPI003722F06D
MNIALAAGYSSGLQGRRNAHQSGALSPRGTPRRQASSWASLSQTNASGEAGTRW